MKVHLQLIQISEFAPAFLLQLSLWTLRNNSSRIISANQASTFFDLKYWNISWAILLSVQWVTEDSWCDLQTFSWIKRSSFHVRFRNEGSKQLRSCWKALETYEYIWKHFVASAFDWPHEGPVYMKRSNPPKWSSSLKWDSRSPWDPCWIRDQG